MYRYGTSMELARKICREIGEWFTNKIKRRKKEEEGRKDRSVEYCMRQNRYLDKYETEAKKEHRSK